MRILSIITLLALSFISCEKSEVYNPSDYDYSSLIVEKTTNKTSVTGKTSKADETYTRGKSVDITIDGVVYIADFVSHTIVQELHHFIIIEDRYEIVVNGEVHVFIVAVDANRDTNEINRVGIYQYNKAIYYENAVEPTQYDNPTNSTWNDGDYTITITK